MTTTQPTRPVSHVSPSTTRSPHIKHSRHRRLRNELRTIFARGDLSSLLMAWGLMIVTALALDAAQWTEKLGSLATISFLAVGFGFLLARSHYSELLALLMSSVYGIAVVLSVNALTLVESGSFTGRTDTLILQLKIWVTAAINGQQPANDDIVFVVFLSILFWYLGHNAAWHIFRVDHVWRVILPAGLVMITNQFYYQGPNALNMYLVIFVIMSLLLLIRSHIDSREYDWFIHQVRFPNNLRQRFFQVGGILAMILVLGAWAIPSGSDDKNLDRVKELLSGNQFVELGELWNRLFSSIETGAIATAKYYGGDELQLSGAIQLGDQSVMIVAAPFGPRYYWRSTIYDSYDFSSWRWKHFRTVRAYTDDTGLQFNLGPTLPGARRDVDQHFTMLISASNLIYAAPQPVRMGVPVEAELDCIEDLQRNCINNNRPVDVAIIRARKTLRTGDTYTVTSSINTASASMLRSAGTAYPDWVLRSYLQGANNVSPRVRELALQIISQAQAGDQTPYDQAKVIERWLRTTIQYNESIPAPPAGSDPVEWFLFDSREGYCNYYATAMVLMLRSQGIPARIAAGFAQGTWDTERSAFLVREREAHTWVEVYFPGYGWVEFEPTADEAPIEREDDQTPQTILPTLTPPPSPTPTPTTTPTALPPAAANNTRATPTNMADSLPIFPTPSPYPSATPAPPPDVTRVDKQNERSLVNTLLLLLTIVALLALAMILIVFFILWFVEYRGLSGLNVIERAYARLAIYARWLNLRLESTATPDERRRYLVDEVPEGEKSFNTITHTYIENRYANPDNTVDTPNQHQVQVSWSKARRVFIQRKLAQWLRRVPKNTS